MNTIARRFATATIAATIGTIAAGAFAAATPAHAWSGCEGDCVNAVSISQTLATKANAKLTFTTAVPANVKITVSAVGAGAVATVNEPSGLRTSHSISTGETLKQGAGFVVSIRATDGNGKSYTDQVSVKAISRTVTLTLKGLRITEDSDYGAGELRAGIGVGGTTSTIFSERSISATKEFSYSKVITATNVPAGAKIAVEVQDNDADPGEFCSGGTGFGFTSGSNSCLDWTTGKAAMTLGTTKGTNSGTFNALGNGRLVFSAWGSYTVTIG